MKSLAIEMLLKNIQWHTFAAEFFWPFLAYCLYYGHYAFT